MNDGGWGGGGAGGGCQINPQKKLPSKSPALLGLNLSSNQKRK